MSRRTVYDCDLCEAQDIQRGVLKIRTSPDDAAAEQRTFIQVELCAECLVRLLRPLVHRMDLVDRHKWLNQFLGMEIANGRPEQSEASDRD